MVLRIVPIESRLGERITIIQSSYVSWKGRFDIIGSIDGFSRFDCVSLARRGWRNRVKTARGGQSRPTHRNAVNKPSRKHGSLGPCAGER
ncbi:hypothetical protein GAY29_03315 [Azospirillum brasilense]|nr:hypothetical protein [Azospirillum brasilense]